MQKAYQPLSAEDKLTDLLNRLRLDRTARADGAVIVESHNDATVLSELLSDRAPTFFPAAGRNNVLTAADMLEANYLRGVICVADTDFDGEPEKRAHQWFLVFTDGADLDAVLFWSEALSRVLYEWATTTRLDDFGGVEGVRVAVVEVTQYVASLRAGNAAEQKGVQFDSVRLEAVVDKNSLELNVESLLSRLSNATGLHRDEIEGLAREGLSCVYTGLPLVNGHDCHSVIAVALRGAIGSRSAGEVPDDLITKSLRLAVKARDLAATPFAARLNAALDQALATPGL